MKRSFLSAALIFSVLGFFALSCNPTKDAQEEVLSADNARIKARESADVQTMSKIYADDYTLVTAEGDIRTKGDQIGEMRSGQLQFRPIELLERTVRIYDDTAIVQSHERSIIIRDGRDIGGDFRANRIYVKRDGRWQLVLTQVTRIAPREPALMQ
jgi:uncharacterized protein (TIGR02246 family)